MSRKKIRVSLAAVAVLALGFSVAGAQAKPVQSTRAKAGTIVLFGDNWMTGLNPNPAYQYGQQAAVDAINKAGGINGQQIKLETCDNKGDVNASSACAQQGIGDKVVAFVGMFDHTCGVQALLTQAQIANIFPNPTCTEMLSSPDSFPLDGGSLGPYIGRAAAYKKLGIHSLGIASNNSSAAIFSTPLSRLSAQVAGIKYAGTVFMTPTTTDFSPQILKLKELGAQAVDAIGGFAQVAGLIKAAASVGFSPYFFATTNQVTEAQYASLGSLAQGKLILASSLPNPRSNIPAMNQFNKEMTADGQAANDFTNRTTGAVVAWLAVHAAANVMKTIKGPITNVTFLAALKKVKAMNLYGLTTWKPNAKGPAAYPRVTAAHVWFLYETPNSNGTLISVPGVPQGVDVLKLAGLTK